MNYTKLKQQMIQEQQVQKEQLDNIQYAEEMQNIGIEVIKL